MTLAIKQSEVSTVSELKGFIEQAFAASESKMAASFAASLAATEARIAARFDAVEARFPAIDQRFEIVRTEAAETKVEILRWMFAFWIAQLGAIAGILKLLK